MRRFLSGVLALGLILSFCLVTAVPALAVPEVWVDDDFTPSTPGWGSTHFATIQDGIAAADLGSGTVHVAEGYYAEHDIDMKNGVKVLGAGADVTTIDGEDHGTVVSAEGVGSGTTFDGFTVTGGSASVGGGMYIADASPVVTKCIFTINSAVFGGGMYIYSNSSPTVASCIFEGNTATTFGGGICCWNSTSSTIVNNTIVGNSALNGGGIYFSNTSTTITNNIIYDNTATTGGGIYCGNPTPAIDYNDVYGNNATTDNNYSGCTAGTGAISALPDFTDAEYHIDSDSPCIDVGDNTAVPGWLITDFEGDPRIWEDALIPTVDMGADEYSDNQPPFAPDTTSSGYRDGSWTDDDTPEFSFIQDDYNNWDTVRYTFQIDDDPLFGSPAVDFTSLLLDQDLLEVFTSSPLPDGEYYWQVRSTDRFDAEGPWADGSSTPGEPAFRLDTSPAPPPGGAVGGTVYPIDKTALLLPWLGLSIFLILAAGGLILVRRRAR